MKQTPENQIKETIKEVLTAKAGRALRYPGLRLFSNPRGNGYMGKPIAESFGRITLDHVRRVSFGLLPGSKEIHSSDMVGWETVTITPDMVGQKFAKFVAVEIKAPGQGLKVEQSRWLDLVNRAGGAGILATGLDDLDKNFHHIDE